MVTAKMHVPDDGAAMHKLQGPVFASSIICHPNHSELRLPLLARRRWRGHAQHLR